MSIRLCTNYFRLISPSQIGPSKYNKTNTKRIWCFTDLAVHRINDYAVGYIYTMVLIFLGKVTMIFVVSARLTSKNISYLCSTLSTLFFPLSYYYKDSKIEICLKTQYRLDIFAVSAGSRTYRIQNYS